MPFHSLLVSMPAEAATSSPATHRPIVTVRAGGDPAVVRRLPARDAGGLTAAAGVAGPLPRARPMRGVARARDAARAWLRRTA